MCAGKFENKHGVAIVVNKKWKHKINWTNNISERAIATSVTVKTQRINLMSVYMPHSGYADHHVENAYNMIEKVIKPTRHMLIIGGDFNAELGPGIGTERRSVGEQTLNEANKRGDWMKQWLMTQKLVALNTMYGKTPTNQATYRTPKGAEKQLDYILVNRKYLRLSKDAEANNMIHMESDHRSVMAQVVIPAKRKRIPAQRSQLDENRQKTGSTPLLDEGVKTADISRFEGRYQELEKGVTERSGKNMKRPQQQSKIMQPRQLLAQARKRVKHPQESDTVLTPTQQQQQAETQQRRQLHEKKRQQA